MAFSVQDYQDLVRLLQEHPEWREQLRSLLLSEDLLALPMIVRQLAEAQQHTEKRLNTLIERLNALTEQVEALALAQQRTEERLNALTERVEALALAQQRTEERLNALTEQVEALALAQQRTEERLNALTERVEALALAQQHTEERLNALTERVEALALAQQRTEERLASLTDQVQELAKGLQRLTDIMGRLKGQVLEITYSGRAGSYFGRLLRQVRVVEVLSLEDTLETILTPEEFEELLLLDLLVNGKVRYAPETPEIWLAIEISSVIDREDIERVVRRAGLLKKAGYRVIPVAAGESVTDGGWELAQSHPVVLVQDGRVAFWERAITEWENIQLSRER